MQKIICTNTLKRVSIYIFIFLTFQTVISFQLSSRSSPFIGPKSLQKSTHCFVNQSTAGHYQSNFTHPAPFFSLQPSFFLRSYLKINANFTTYEFVAE